jgi:hypothetical protein
MAAADIDAGGVSIPDAVYLTVNLILGGPGRHRAGVQFLLARSPGRSRVHRN